MLKEKKKKVTQFIRKFLKSQLAQKNQHVKGLDSWTKSSYTILISDMSYLKDCEWICMDETSDMISSCLSSE